MRAAPILLALVALVFTSADPVWSQDSTRVEAGSRVRVKAQGADQRWLAGELLQFRADTLRLRTADPPDSVTLTTGSLAGLELSRGRKSQAGKGAALGAGVGVILGLVVGAVTYEDDCPDCLGLDPGVGGSALLGGVLFGVLGLGVGALIGASVDAERWEPLPQPWSGETSGP